MGTGRDVERRSGYPSRLHGWQNDVLTKSQMGLSYFYVPVFLSMFFFFFFVLGRNTVLWLTECSRPTCLWTACVPWACPIQQRVFLHFFPLSVCLFVCLSVCLSVTSWMLPLSRRQHRHSATGRTPSRNTKKQTWCCICSQSSRCAARKACGGQKIVTFDVHSMKSVSLVVFKDSLINIWIDWELYRSWWGR